jgi:hypothetical protein
MYYTTILLEYIRKTMKHVSTVSLQAELRLLATTLFSYVRLKVLSLFLRCSYFVEVSSRLSRGTFGRSYIFPMLFQVIYIYIYISYIFSTVKTTFHERFMILGLLKYYTVYAISDFLSYCTNVFYAFR